MAVSLMTYRIILMVAVLLTGSFNTVLKSCENKSFSVGIDGERVRFRKPWTQTAFMFFGELSALLYYFIEKWYLARKQRVSRKNDGNQPLLGEEPVNYGCLKSSPNSPPVYYYLPPACLDLIGTAFGSIGLLYISASVWQMMRGCTVIFSAVLSIIFLKRKLYSFHWIGIAVTAIGLLVVGASSLLSSDNSGVNATFGQQLFGFGIFSLGLLSNSAQLIVEELLLKKRQVDPALIVGQEGIWGVSAMAVTLTILYFIPGDDKGSYENAYDAAVMIKNNAALICFVIGQWAAVWWYNVIALKITKSLSVVHRTLLDSARTCFVWTFNLFIHYVISSDYGEAFTKWSWLQMAGFALLILGMIIYNRLIDLPCVTYDGSVGKLTAVDDVAKKLVTDTATDSTATDEIVVVSSPTLTTVGGKEEDTETAKH